MRGDRVSSQSAGSTTILSAERSGSSIAAIVRVRRRSIDA
jgi:hypothetical protein